MHTLPKARDERKYCLKTEDEFYTLHSPGSVRGESQGTGRVGDETHS